MIMIFILGQECGYDDIMYFNDGIFIQSWPLCDFPVFVFFSRVES